MEQRVRELFEKLALPYPAVAIKYCYSQPEGVERVDEQLSFCQFVKKAQDTGKKFFVTKDDDNCFGKMVLGMVPKKGLEASGQAGYEFGVFKTQAANARLYNLIPTLVQGACNFVVFCPVSICDFDPDLVICVAETAQADIIMRATSYISGDLWESKGSHVLCCAWTYAYPVISGKVNFFTTGMSHGMKRRKVYPAGLNIIAIPFEKLPELSQALDEMDWELIAMREDEESKALLKKKFEKLKNMSPDFILKE